MLTHVISFEIPVVIKSQTIDLQRLLLSFSMILGYLCLFLPVSISTIASPESLGKSHDKRKHRSLNHSHE